MNKFLKLTSLYTAAFVITASLVTIVLGNTNVLAQSNCPERYGDCAPSSTQALLPPQIDFYATQYSVPYAGTTMLMWKVKYATTCNIFKNGNLLQQAVNPVEGYNQQSNIITNLTFKMACTNSIGSDEKLVAISVTGSGGSGGPSFNSRLTTYYSTSSPSSIRYHTLLPGMTYAEAVGVAGGSGGGADGWWWSGGYLGSGVTTHHGCPGGTSNIDGTVFTSLKDVSGYPNTIALYVGVGGAAGIKDGGYGPGYGGWGGWSRVTVYRYKTDRSPEIVNDLMPEPSGYGYSGAWFVDPNFKCVTYNRFWQVITPITSWTSPRSGLTYDTSIAAQPGSNRVIAPGAGAGGAGSNDTNPNGYRGRDGIVWIYERDQL